MIAYKVVGKNTRHCSNWAVFMLFYGYQKKEYLKFRKKNIEYFPRYLKNTTVKMAPNSSGILCFKDIQSARSFMLSICDSVNFKIIKVKGYNKIKVDLLVSGCSSDPKEIFYEKTMCPPKGTVAFKSVKVLE